MDRFLYDNGLRHERVNKHLTNYLSIIYLDIGTLILALIIYLDIGTLIFDRFLNTPLFVILREANIQEIFIANKFLTSGLISIFILDDKKVTSVTNRKIQKSNTVCL